MTMLQWDTVGDRTYETGVDRGVLFPQDTSDGSYPTGYPWNGLTTVTESPTGAEATPQYADNIQYLNLISIETFGFTIEAFTYPDEFAACDGTQEPTAGVRVGQQNRQPFGFAYRTLKGNDTEATDYGYILKLIYGASAKPSEKAHATVNDTPEAIDFSWECTTSPVTVPGYKPSATIDVDSTVVTAAGLAALELILYGSSGAAARLPLPAEVFALFEDNPLTVISPTIPTFASDVITIPSFTGAVYRLNGVVVAAGTYTITADADVTVTPQPGYVFPNAYVNEWEYKHS